jgi:hypothetical protein
LTILTIAGAIGALSILAALVATLEHLDCKARERRWRRALASFDMVDTRTALVDPPSTRPMLSLKGPTRL